MNGRGAKSTSERSEEKQIRMKKTDGLKGTAEKGGVFRAMGLFLHLDYGQAVRQSHYAFFEKVASISQDYRRNGGQYLYHCEPHYH